MLGEKIMTIPQELLILGAAVKIGMLEAMRKSTTCEDLVKELTLNPRAVWMVVEALADLGYITRQGEAVTLSEEARNMIYNPAAPNYIGFAFMHRYNLFRKVSQVLVPGGRIAIVDMVRGTNPFASVFGVNMLVNTSNGGTWTLDQYTDWLAGAGFLNVKLDEVAGLQIITAVLI